MKLVTRESVCNNPWRARALFGPRDRVTLKAYFGVQQGRSKRVIERIAHYDTGTISKKKIELTQTSERKTGYLELTRLVTFEIISLSAKEKAWYMFLNNEASLAPEIAKSSTRVKEAVVGSNDKLSLSPYGTIPHLQQPATVAVNDREVMIDVEKRERVIG